MISAYNIGTEQKHLVLLSGGCLHHFDFLFFVRIKSVRFVHLISVII